MKLERTSNLPERIKDPVLGMLQFSAALDGMDEYQTKVVLDGRRITLDLYTDGSGDLKPCIDRARRIVAGYAAIKAKIRTYVRTKVFPNYNETWRPDKKPITLDQFLNRLKLVTVTTHPTPEATFWFDSGNLFLGHGLQLRMTERNRFVSHDLPG